MVDFFFTAHDACATDAVCQKHPRKIFFGTIWGVWYNSEGSNTHLRFFSMFRLVFVGCFLGVFFNILQE